MWEIGCTLLHTDGRLLVAQQCCIRRALFAYMRPRNMPNTTPLLGNRSTNAQLGCRSIRHTVSGAASVRLLCCFVL